MNPITLWNPQGEKIGEFAIPGVRRLQWMKGRLSIQPETGIFYKGAGCPYACHYDHEVEPGDIAQQQIEVCYIGWRVVRPCLVGKTGVFIGTRYQPQFSDPIGGCGPKERAILTNSQAFSLASPEIIDCLSPHPETDLYVLTYRGGRAPLLESYTPHKLRRLMKALLNEGWNIPWDKNAIDDVNWKGRITDTADLFPSTALPHRFGTIYSLLYSLRAARPDLYQDFARHQGLPDSLHYLPYQVVMILQSMNMAESLGEDTPYFYLIDSVLIEGKTCAGLEDPLLDELSRHRHRQKLQDALELSLSRKFCHEPR